MHAVVITGTDVRGCTYHIKEIFLEALKADRVTEFTLPSQAPPYCLGCKRCFTDSESKCPHAHRVQPIWDAMLHADLLVFAYPVYVMRAPGHVKALLDHLGVHWFAHRPDPRMFHKRAVILTQSIGAPNGAAQKDVKTALTWMGVPSVDTLGFGLMEGVVWEALSEERRHKIAKKLRGLALKISVKDDKPRWNLKNHLFFKMCRSMQGSLRKKLKPGERPSADLQHWIDHGWV